MNLNKLYTAGTASLLLSTVLPIAAFAGAPPVSLPPGTTTDVPVPTITTSTPPFGDTLLREVQSAVFATNGTNIIKGTITSAAFRSSANVLDFTYQIALDGGVGGTNIIVDAFSLASFKDVAGVLIGQTSEDVDGATGLPALDLGGTNQNGFGAGTSTAFFSAASRNNPNGDGINLNFSSGVRAGENSFTFVVRTQATSYATTGSASIQGGGISAFTPANGLISPVGAPEPDAMPLLALGLVPLIAGRVRRRQ